MYDISYSLRGVSGIPRDAINLAEILLDIPECNFLLFPSKRIARKRSGIAIQTQIGQALRNSSPSLSFRPSLNLIRDILFSLLAPRRLRYERPDDNIRKNITISGLKIPTSRIRIANLTIGERWIRMIFNRTFRLTPKECDLYIQQQIDPFSIARGTKAIIRLHDILPITHPEFFTQRANEVFLFSLKRMIKNRGDITWVMDSKATASDFKKLLNPVGDVLVIPCAIGDDCLRYEAKIKNYNQQNQIIMVNTIEPRKNVEFVVDNFIRAKKSGLIDSTWSLKILGSKGWESRRLLKKLDYLDDSGEIHYFDGASRTEVLEELSSSKVFVTASLAEGFGLPPLEALARGCRVLASSIPQHVETLGARAKYFDPTDAEDFLESLGLACNVEADLSVEERIDNLNFVHANFSKESLKNAWVKLINDVMKQ